MKINENFNHNKSWTIPIRIGSKSCGYLVNFGWKVRKARKAFEKELLKGGMPKEAARKLAKKYSSVKDDAMKQLWSSAKKFRW